MLLLGELVWFVVGVSWVKKIGVLIKIRGFDASTIDLNHKEIYFLKTAIAARTLPCWAKREAAVFRSVFVASTTIRQALS